MSLLFEVGDPVPEIVSPGWVVPPWETHLKTGWGHFDDEWIGIQVPTNLSSKTIVEKGAVIKGEDGLLLKNSSDETSATINLVVAAGVGGHCEVTSTEFKYKMIGGHLVKQHLLLTECTWCEVHAHSVGQNGEMVNIVFTVPSHNQPLIRIVRTGDLGPSFHYTEVHDGTGQVIGVQPVAPWREMTLRYWRSALTSRSFKDVREYFPAGK